MDKNKEIPQGYMTGGEAAKKMDVTVRTLQHYDREGLINTVNLQVTLYIDKIG
jgi:predicted site-specific integrase-resolvase